jgi:ABC-type uncharacterized transport system involved in gliding motility auxiliary subunit
VSIAAVATIPPGSLAGNTSSAVPAGQEKSNPGSTASTEQTGQTDQDKRNTSRAARLVVFGDSEFANNNLLTSSPGNRDLFLNTVSWLAEEEDLISIRPQKGGTSGPVILTAAQAPLIFWLPVVIVPLAVFAAGAMVFVSRRWQQ